MESAFADYEVTAASARAVAESAAPALAAVAGMTEEAPLAAANAALGELTAILDDPTLSDPPPPYERGDVDMADLDEIAAATQEAENYAERVTAATREVSAARTALVEKLTALTAAQVALGSSIPATAVAIVDENFRASSDAAGRGDRRIPGHPGGTGDRCVG